MRPHVRPVPPAPLDPFLHDDPRGLRRRLGAAVAGIVLGAVAASHGLPADDDHRAGSAVVGAPAPDAHGAASGVAVATPVAAAAAVSVVTRAAAPHAAPVGETEDGAMHRWSTVLGFEGATLGGFDDLRIAAAPPQASGTDVVPASVEAPDGAPSADASSAGDAFVVMIDPGHGGTDPGSVAPNGLLEKELTADIAERTRRFLSEVDGIDVRLTREGDTGLSRQGRVDRIRASGADLVVSLHFNHLPQTDVTLVESYYAAAENIEESRAIRRAANGGIELVQTIRPDLSFTEGSARLAGLMQRRVYGEVVHGNSGAIDAGVKRDTLFVLTRSLVPGALIELTCLSNPAEAERLEGGDYRDRLAAALADAVRDYRGSLESRPLGSLDT